MEFDLNTLNLSEARITLKKFEGEQTDEPFETIIIENGEIVEVRRKEDGTT
jgi:hypothetical protein